ncbi:MAG: tRNA (adenosine(37)-N6)-dimethylallyltransferase MiaA [Deltaproteobacteria bacterium]|jgi:tRNA dimethylallyltransferase|nr:tRNA (adenosine(37)-N6)-dimethylallyltransferase MiaA [Deltaproteobacteria bacterium]
MTPKVKIAVIAGPTCVGKSSVALYCASKLGANIVNADSLSFYRYLDIGTAKPSLAERAKVPHHLIDILDPADHFCAADYINLARPLIETLGVQGTPVLVVGGTGLYLRSLTKGLFDGPGRDDGLRAQLRERAKKGEDLYALLSQIDPLTAQRLKRGDTTRVERALEFFELTGESISIFQERHGLRESYFETKTIVLEREVKELDGLIEARTEEMFNRGLIEETENLLLKGYSKEIKPLKAVGYLESVEVILGNLTMNEAKKQTFIRTRRLAKRQRTWFRGQCPEAERLSAKAEVVLKALEGFWG